MAESKYYGIYQGVVTNIKDPENRGRLKVKCPDVLGGNTESAWCDPMIQVAYDNGGDFCIPAKDEAVWLMFIAGDANRPVWLGGWWQKNMSPLGSNYSDVDKVRIINYADCTITMKNGTININVGAGVCDLKIEHNLVTIKGDLIVEGEISAYSVTAGDIIASAGDNGGGTIKADKEITTVSIGAKDMEADSVTVDNVKSKNVEATVQVKGSTIVGSTDIVVNSVSLTSHKHSGVTAGSDNTGSPIT